MSRPVLSEQSTTEYFKELVEEALVDRRVDAGDLTEYLPRESPVPVHRPDLRPSAGDAEQPLAIRLGRALDTGGQDQRARLRNLGDFSLFMSGFFSDSFRRKAVDIDYYKSMGEYAYGSLSRSERDAFAEVFGELARKFVGFMDVLAHVSDRTTAGSPEVDVLRLLRSGSAPAASRDGQRLIDRGLLPNQSIGPRFLQ